MKRIVFTILFCLIVIVQFTSAQIPQTISYQGVLTDANGNPVSDGNYSLTFKLYDVPTSGDSLWNETQNVQVSSGLFNVVFGSVTPLNLPFDKQYWLGISVGSGAELTPRTALTASPYSLNSHSTLVEPQPGQGLTIRNSSGEATHQFDANGAATHSGIGKFWGGIVIGDSILIPDSGNVIMKTKTMSNIKSTNKTPSSFSLDLPALPEVGISANGEKYGVSAYARVIAVYGSSWEGKGIYGESEENDGVFGRSNILDGVHGTSNSGRGVSGSSKTDAGVSGISNSGFGVYGSSNQNKGVYGLSVSSDGVYGISSSGVGVSGHSENYIGIYGQGVFGGWFSNKVKVVEVPPAPDQTRFLVWDYDDVIKYRELPSVASFDGVLQDKAFIVKSGATEVFRVDTNGNSYHKGVETFDDDVIFKGTDGKGAKLVDGSGNTIAGFGRKDLETGQRFGVYGKAENAGDLAGVFDGDVEVNGEIVAGSFHVVNGNGDTLTSFNADGTSTHAGLETYEMGIKTTLNNSNILRIDPAEGFTIKTPTGQFIAHIRYDGAAYFAGNVSKGGGSFKIDHPLDPANKFLYHSFVESPDMMNIYNGNVTLNNNGEAVVELPEWFEALNKDFRYQLTCIGGFAQVYIAEKINDNHFKIAGGAKGIEVSWQVTGIRKDAFADKHRIPVEELKKGDEIGHYLHPDAFGLREEKGITYSNSLELMHVVKEYKNKD